MPTSADNVFIDANSGSAPVITLTATANCLNLDCTGAATPTIAGSSNLNVYGSFTLATGLLWTNTGTIAFNATSTGKTITTHGVTIASQISFNGVGGEWTLEDNFMDVGSSISVSNGSLIANGMTINCSHFYTGDANTRTIDITNSTINCARWTLVTTTLTFNVSGSQINMTATNTFAGGGATYNNVTFSAVTITVTGSNTFNVLTMTPGCILKLTSATTQTLLSPLVCKATAAIPSTLQAVTSGSAATIDLPSGDYYIRHTSVKDITVTGATSLTDVAGTNISGNTGITFSSSFDIAKVNSDGSLSSYDPANGSMRNVWQEFNAQQADVVQREINVMHPPSPLVACKIDGTTDDSTAIAAMITYLGSTGGRLFFPIGNCLVNSTISLPSNIWICGSAGGSEQAISSKIFTNTAIDIFSISDGSIQPTNIKFQGIVLDGGSVGTRGVNVDNGIIYAEDCFFENFVTEGLRLNNAYTSKIFRCFFRSNTIGINFVANSNSIVIRDCRMLSNTTAFSFTSSAHKVTITGTSMENGTDGIIVGSGDVDGLTVSECYFETFTGSHIKALSGTSPVRNLLIQGNHMHGSGTVAYNIVLQAGNGIKIENNSIFSFTTAGIQVASGTNRVELINNYNETANVQLAIEDNSHQAIIRTWFQSSLIRTSNEWANIGGEQGFNNLITNGSFEQGSTNWIATNCALTLSTSTGVIEGLNSLLVTPSSNVGGRAEQIINVDMKYAIGRLMTFSAYIALGTSTSVRFRVTTNSGNVASVFVTQDGYYSITGLIPAASTSLTISLYADTVSGTGTAYFDVVSANFGANPIRYSPPYQTRKGSTTTLRPPAPKLYEMYFDTTLGKPIWWNGANWKDATGTTV